MSVESILERVRRGELQIEEARRQLELLTIRDVEDFAKLDVFRHLRRGIPEIVFAEKKSKDETLKIVSEMVECSGKTIVSRLRGSHLKELRKLAGKYDVEIFEKAKMAVVRKHGLTTPKTGGKAGILTAGTSDTSVAEEAAVVLRESGCEVYSAYDVGVAGLHRLFHPLRNMLDKGVDVIIVVAGMEGTLPGIVASLVDKPVIGVPTSSGYGYGGKGKGALMAMLQSCSLGLSVVNVDNGVGAGALAAIIANKAMSARMSASQKR